jgi:uroporphyrinogen-III synthase
VRGRLKSQPAGVSFLPQRRYHERRRRETSDVPSMRDKRIAILEARLGQQMVELIAKHGGVPLHAPALAEVPDVDHSYISRLVSELVSRPVRIAIFQTGVGTQALFKATDTLGLTETLLGLLAKMTVVARGPKPTAALRSRAVRIDLSASEPFTTTEVLAVLHGVPLAGERVIVQRYGVTNVELEETLRAQGAEVIEIPTYRWSLPPDTEPLIALLDALEANRVDAVTFTNAAQVHNLFDVAEARGRADALRAGLNRTLVASVGPVSSAALKEFGVAVAVEASPPKLGPLVAALNQAFAQR